MLKDIAFMRILKIIRIVQNISELIRALSQMQDLYTLPGKSLPIYFFVEITSRQFHASLNVFSLKYWTIYDFLYLISPHKKTYE